MSSRYGGAITVADINPYPGFCIGSNPTGSAIGVFRAIYDTLVERNADEGFTPFLAESIVASNNNKKWTIRLRSGVTFHDGSSLTSSVLKLNLDSMRGVESTGIPLSRVAGIINLGLTNIMSIDIVDSLTIDVNLELPQIDFIESLYLGGRGGIRAEAQLKSTACSTNAIGTGPFRLASFTSTEVSLQRNNNYWRMDPVTGNQLPYLDQLNFSVIREGLVRKTALLGDESTSSTADVALFSSIRDAATIKDMRIRTGQVNEYATRNDDVLTVWLNAGKAGSPLTNLKARLALAHATDVRRFRNVNFLGLGEAPSGLMPRRSSMYTTEGFPQYNLNLARQLVAEFKSETGLPSLEVTIPSTTSSIDYSIWASLQSMWADAGIVLNIIQEESAVIIAKAVNASRLGAEQNFYDLVPLTMSFGSESGYNSMFFRSDAFNPNTTNPSFPSGSVHRTKLATVINFSHQPDNIMDQKLLEAHAQPTLKLAGVKYREAIKHYQQNAYAIPVVNGFLTAFTSKRIAGIGTSYLATGVPEKFMNAGGPNWSVVYRTAENVSRSISATNIDINKEVWTGAHPQGVVALSAETAYAPRTEEGEICRVSMELGSVATCTYVGGRPIGLISDKDKVDGFFLDLDTKKVRRMTFSTSSVVDIATIPGAPFAIAVNSEKSTGFVSSIETGKIYRIDLNQGVVTSTIDVPGGPSGIVIENGGKALWVAQSLLGTIKKIPLGSSSVVHVLSKHELSVVQTANAVSTVQQYEIVVGSRPTGLSISPDGKLLLVANENDDTVSMVSTETNVVQATLSVPGQPRYLSFGDVTNRALVAGVFSNSIADIRLPTVGSTTPVETPNLDVPQTGGPGQPVETPPLPASGPGTAVVPNPISSPKPTLLVARIGRSLSSKQLLAAGKISVKPKSKIKIKIAAGSSKVCKALGTNVKALKPGTCRVSIEVTPPKGKKTLRTISFKVTK